MFTRLRSLPVVIFTLALGVGANGQTDNSRISDFLNNTEMVLDRLSEAASLAEWEAYTNISNENDAKALTADTILDEEKKRRSDQARGLAVNSATPDEKRKLLLLKLNSDGIIADSAKNIRLAQIRTDMKNNFANACPVIDAGKPCLKREKIDIELQSNRNPERLKHLWISWYDTARPIRTIYPEYVELTNQGARDSGYLNAADMSKAAYEVDPVEFERDLDELWRELKPLYLLLHSYVRKQLVSAYGSKVVDPAGPIPIHLTGNLWGQEWENIADLLSIPGGSSDYSALLKNANLKPDDFVNLAERFFTSLGFPSLPVSFREKSYFSRPRPNFDCHPSAWPISAQDWRLKMCLEVTWTDFLTTHHEMGHIFYFQSFSHQPFLFRDAPNQGINEAIGDAAALSVTPDYLRRIGILPSNTGANDDLNQLMHVALRKLARVPFGLMLQKWRWGVMSGRIPPERYNEAWWELVQEYQGLVPPSPRPNDVFDPGAKQHIAADIDYIRYFLADVLTFQIHEALSREAKCAEPIHRCSIFESREAGNRWRAALALGASKPWSEALKVMTGEDRILGRSMRNYLAPLETWLKEATKDSPIGWTQ